MIYRDFFVSNGRIGENNFNGAEVGESEEVGEIGEGVRGVGMVREAREIGESVGGVTLSERVVVL